MYYQDGYRSVTHLIYSFCTYHILRVEPTRIFYQMQIKHKQYTISMTYTDMDNSVVLRHSHVLRYTYWAS